MLFDILRLTYKLRVEFLRNLAITVGLFSVAVSVVLGNEKTIFIKPIIHILLFFYFTFKAGTFNKLFLFTVLCALFGEMFFALGFTDNFNYILLLFVGYFIGNAFLLKPVILATKYNKGSVDLTAPIIGTLGVLLLVGLVSSLVIGRVPSVWVYGICVVSFLIFLCSCFYILIFNKSHLNFLLFFVGVGYLGVCILFFMDEFFEHDIIFVGLGNSLELVAQISFVCYLTKIKQVLQAKPSFY